MKNPAVLITMLIFCAWLAAPAQGLRNPSFEEPDNPDDILSDHAAAWGRWGHWINRETSWSPTRSGDCLLGYHHFRIETPDTSGVYQDVPDIPEETKCTFTVYACKDPGSNFKSIEVRLEPFDGGATLASASFDRNAFQPGVWIPLTVSASNPTRGIRTLIILTPREDGQREGAVKFDDAELKLESATATP